MDIQMSVACPLCGSINQFVVEHVFARPELILCDQESGGCDEFFVVSVVEERDAVVGRVSYQALVGVINDRSSVLAGIDRLMGVAVAAESPFDVFVNFSAHVDQIEVRVNKGALYNKEPVKGVDRLVLNRCVDVSRDDAIDELAVVARELEALLDGGTL